MRRSVCTLRIAPRYNCHNPILGTFRFQDLTAAAAVTSGPTPLASASPLGAWAHRTQDRHTQACPRASPCLMDQGGQRTTRSRDTVHARTHDRLGRSPSQGSPDSPRELPRASRSGGRVCTRCSSRSRIAGSHRPSIRVAAAAFFRATCGGGRVGARGGYPPSCASSRDAAVARPLGPRTRCTGWSLMQRRTGSA